MERMRSRIDLCCCKSCLVKMRTLTMLLVLQMFLSQLIAQTSFLENGNDVKMFDRGASLTLIFPSFNSSGYSNLNQLVVENGYPFIPKGNLNYGIGVSYRLKRLEPGINGLIGYQSRTNEMLNSRMSRTPLTGNILLRYHLVRKGSFTFYPLIGYSFTDTNLILSKESSSNDLDNLLRNPGTSVNLWHSSEGLLVGFGADIAEHWVESSGIFRLKFAYRIPSGSYQWESDFANLTTNLRKDSFPYFFIQLEFGKLEKRRSMDE